MKIPHSDPTKFFCKKIKEEKDDNDDFDDKYKKDQTVANYYEHPLLKNKKGKIASLSVFKKSLKPEWEDKVCGKGATLVYVF